MYLWSLSYAYQQQKVCILAKFQLSYTELMLVFFWHVIIFFENDFTNAKEAAADLVPNNLIKSDLKRKKSKSRRSPCVRTNFYLAIWLFPFVSTILLTV